jgi:TRAP-type C4-dicarboxylate transport system permease large subunit
VIRQYWWFGWVLTYSKFPFAAAASIASIAPGLWLFLLLVIALYIVLVSQNRPSVRDGSRCCESSIPSRP